MTYTFHLLTIPHPIKICVREEFLSHMRLTTSHSSIALCNAIKDVFIEKGLDVTKITFSRLDGTDSMAGEVAGLQSLETWLCFQSMLIVGATDWHEYLFT